MSATIPNNMLMSDLLKATGYDCPSNLKGKTFKQSTAGAGIDIETNKAVSVNVQEYTQAIAIVPSDTYEAMEKVTLTLTGIENIDVETNKAVSVNVQEYAQAIEIVPSDTYDAMGKVTLTLNGIVGGLKAFGSAEKAVYLTEIPSADGAVKAYVPSATGLTKTDATYAEATGVTISEVAYARYATGDITF